MYCTVYNDNERVEITCKVYKKNVVRALNKNCRNHAIVVQFLVKTVAGFIQWHFIKISLGGWC